MTLDRLEQALREAAGHLYDPTFRAAEDLWWATGCDPKDDLHCLRGAVLEAIETLRPGADVPPSARLRRIHDLLSCRFGQDLTQEEIAQRLGITTRHLRREQQEAIALLARRLWDRRESGRAASEEPQDEPASDTASRSQMRAELAALQKSAPSSASDVGDTLRGAASLVRTLAARHGLELEWEPVEPGLLALIHPTALRQVVVLAVGQIVQVMSTGKITVGADRAGASIAVWVRGTPLAGLVSQDPGLLAELLAGQGATLKVEAADDSLELRALLRRADQIKVLVFEDNDDLLHFYKRYVGGTRYTIVPGELGARSLERIGEISPNVIVLDVMLPDIDGWQLLAYLHEHPATRSVPVIVCSVIREEELALALGAAAYLPKPVSRADFIAKLDWVVGSGGLQQRARRPVECTAAAGRERDLPP